MNPRSLSRGVSATAGQHDSRQDPAQPGAASTQKNLIQSFHVSSSLLDAVGSVKQNPASIR